MRILFFWSRFTRMQITFEMLKETFEEKLESKLSYKIRILEEFIWQYKPDLVFLHCHTEDGDFKRMKMLSKSIRAKLPKCMIIITYHPDVEEEYHYKFLGGYTCDLMIPEFPIESNMIKKIHRLYNDNYPQQ